MRIIRSSLWSRLDIILTILNPFSNLDPTIILSNSDLFLLYHNGRLCSFATLKHYNSKVREIKSVYTYPRYRGLGHASALLKHIVSRNKPLYLVCRLPLESYYMKNNFRRVSKPPRELASRVSLWNSIFGKFSNLRAIILEYE